MYTLSLYIYIYMYIYTYTYIDSGSSKTSDPQRLLLNLSDNINLQRKDKYVALSNFSIYYT